MSDPSPALNFDLLTERQMADGLGVCTRTLKRWRAYGEGPPHLRIGRTIYYRRASLEAWIAKQERRAA